MAFTIPNAAAATFPPQAQVFQTDLDILVAGDNKTGVVSGCAITTTGAANNGVTVAAGVVIVGTDQLTVTTGTVTLTAPDGTNPRIDLVWADNTGTKGKTDGTASATPQMPALPASTVVLAAVYSPAAGGNTVSPTWITDKRVIIEPEWSFAYLASDFVINSGAADALTDITGMSFSVKSGFTYQFRYLGSYAVAATTTGSRWTINGPTMNWLWYTSTYGLTATTVTSNPMLTAIQLPGAANATSNISNGGGNLTIIEGLFNPSADGTLQIQGTREVTAGGATVTVKAGAILNWKRTV